MTIKKVKKKPTNEAATAVSQRQTVFTTLRVCVDVCVCVMFVLFFIKIKSPDLCFIFLFFPLKLHRPTNTLSPLLRISLMTNKPCTLVIYTCNMYTYIYIYVTYTVCTFAPQNNNTHTRIFYVCTRDYHIRISFFLFLVLSTCVCGQKFVLSTAKSAGRQKRIVRNC